MKIRRIISLTVFLSFIFLAWSGVMLFLSPQGRVAYWAGWTLLGLSKEQYSAVHTTFMVLFLTTGIWHIVLNWRPIVGYLKDRSKKIRLFTPESSVALGLSLAFLAGPLLRFPPFEQFLRAGEDIKGYWEDTRGSPPWGHAEESRLDAFCRRIVDFQRWEGEGAVVVDCDEALAALGEAGMVVDSPTERIIDIARSNETTPQAIADIIIGVARSATPEEVAAGLAGVGPGRGAGSGAGESGGSVAPSGAQPRFQHPPSGLGRLTLREYAEDYGYDLDEIVAILAGKGMTVDPDARLREAADGLGTDPAGILEALNAGG
jgi:hypothetical protein